MESLAVEIPARFKQNLEKRFNPANAVRDKKTCIIAEPCCVCKSYFYPETEDDPLRCNGCPFEKFKTKTTPGCRIWIKKVPGSNPRFACCIEKAKHLITWTD